MTKCRSGRKNSVERFSRYCNFFGCWGAWKRVFGNFVKYLIFYPYDLAEIWHAALKWRVITTCRSGRKYSVEWFSRYCNFFEFLGGLKMGFLDFCNFCVILVPRSSGTLWWCARMVISWERRFVDIFFQFWDIFKKNYFLNEKSFLKKKIFCKVVKNYFLLQSRAWRGRTSGIRHKNRPLSLENHKFMTF